MKCVLKAKCSKEVFLDNAFLSVECKQRDEYTYGWYLTKADAAEDSTNLLQLGIFTEILKGWEVEGFVTFTKLMYG